MANILVVDDSLKIRSLVQNVLVRADHDVLLAKDFFEAQDILDTYRFDLVILDINMPYQDGFSALKTMRGTDRFRFQPVVVMTSRNSKRDVKKAVDLEAEAYILKPIVAHDFVEKIDRVLLRRGRKDSSFYVSPIDEIGNAKMTNTHQGKITKISEIGVDVICEQKYLVGQEIQLNTPLFSHIGFDSMTLKVLGTHPDGENHLHKLSYVGMSHESLQMLRSWLHDHQEPDSQSEKKK